MIIMNLKSKIKLKRVTKLDLKLLIEWRNSKNLFPYNTQYFLLNSKMQMDWFNKIQNDSSKKMFMIFYGKLKIGICGLIDIDNENKNAKIAIIIGKESLHGMGIGTIVISHLLKYGFEKLELHRINSEVIEFNKNSIHLFEKSQFKLDATYRDVIWRNNRWWNMKSMSIFRNDFNKF
jgi:UDP-4-amino-4,6-dideoxy-N-acetyl-beta-L-altrosamine N-acetyltransferase